MDNSIEKEMQALLYNFWIVKDEDSQMYYKIKYNQNKLKDFITKNLGSNLIIHDRFIKLEKIPNVVNSNNGIPLFSSTLEYVILTLLLLYLEDKTRGERFILSNLIDYIKNTSITLELNHIPDWNKVNDRRCLSNVIKFLNYINVLKTVDEDNISFTEDINAEALYETTGLSNYVMRMFDNEISSLNTCEDFLKNEFSSQNENKGDVRRFKVFRNILYTPVVSTYDLSDSEIDYIKKNRLYIKNEIDKVNMDTEITHNMVILYDNNYNNLKYNFPNNQKICEIVLMLNNEILNDIKSGLLRIETSEIVKTKTNYLKQKVRELRDTKGVYIGKTRLDYSPYKLYAEIIECMEKYNLISINDDDVIIYPSISRFIGKTMDIIDENKDEQISLFGGSDEL